MISIVSIRLSPYPSITDYFYAENHSMAVVSITSTAMFCEDVFRLKATNTQWIVNQSQNTT